MFKKSPEQRLEEAKKRVERASAHRDKAITRQQEAHFRPWWKIRPSKEGLAEIDRKTEQAERLLSEAQTEVERIEDEIAGYSRSRGGK